MADLDQAEALLIVVVKPKVHIDEKAQRVTTTLPDGSQVIAEPVNDLESHCRAKALGYDDGHHLPNEIIWAMTRDHDRLHCLIADALGHEHSYALWHAAHPDNGPYGLRWADREERLVMLIARLLNQGIDTVMADHNLVA